MSAVIEQSKQRSSLVSERMRGNKNAAKGKEWFGAVKWALKKYETNSIKRGLALRQIALKLVEDAIDGKEYAIREISERLDGKIGAGSDSGTVRVLVVRGDSAQLLDAKPVLEHDPLAQD